jgi:hypothetical protein
MRPLSARAPALWKSLPAEDSGFPEDFLSASFYLRMERHSIKILRRKSGTILRLSYARQIKDELENNTGLFLDTPASVALPSFWNLGSMTSITRKKASLIILGAGVIAILATLAGRHWKNSDPAERACNLVGWVKPERRPGLDSPLAENLDANAGMHLPTSHSGRECERPGNAEQYVDSICRGRDISRPIPPAQIRTSTSMHTAPILDAKRQSARLGKDGERAVQGANVWPIAACAPSSGDVSDCDELKLSATSE